MHCYPKTIFFTLKELIPIENLKMGLCEKPHFLKPTSTYPYLFLIFVSIIINIPIIYNVIGHKSIELMFSGIVEETAKLVDIVKENDNVHFTLTCSFVNDLKIDQSISHNGVCLTVVDLKEGNYTVTAMRETLDRSNLGLLKVGELVNVERSMKMNGRLDGHIVQGHVDQTAVCTEIKDANGSWYFTFKYKFDKEMAKRGYFTVDKGSVTINGVSLTVCEPTEDSFTVAIIPYTYEYTNFHAIQVGGVVNLEFDIIGKYISRLQELTAE